MNRTPLVCLLASLAVATAALVAADTATVKADRFLERHVQALGGEEVLRRITTRQSEGLLERHGRAVPIVSYAQAPNLVRIETRFPQPGTLLQGFDGATAWLLHPRRGGRVLDERETAAFAAQAWLHPALHIAAMYPVRRWVGTETSGDEEIAVLALGRDESRLETWRFDASTRRLLEIERQVDAGAHGEVRVVVRFEEYRPVDGTMCPFIVRTRLPAFETVLRLDSVRHNVPLDDTLFRVPAGRAAR